MITFDGYKKHLGDTVRTLREQAGLSMRALGLMADVHYNQICKIENGKANPSLKTIFLLAEALNVDVRDLLPQTERTTPNPLHYFIKSSAEAPEDSIRKRR